MPDQATDTPAKATDNARPRGRRPRPTVVLRNEDPEQYISRVRIAARARLEGASWFAAATQSAIPYETLKSWSKQPLSRGGKVWRAVTAELAAQMGTTPQGDVIEPPPPIVVSTDGFTSPEQFCDRWSLDAARVQVECMLDKAVPKRERLTAASRIQDLGGHSPISRSVVITAPLDDPRLAAALLGVLDELKQVGALAPPPLYIEVAREGEGAQV